MKELIEILVTLGFLGVLMWGMLKFLLKDIHRDLIEIKDVIKEMKQDNKLRDQRLDHLYQVSIELMKKH
jgi:hypothetical protein